MPAPTLAKAFDLLHRSQLLAPEQLRELEELRGRHHDAEGLVRSVLKRGWVTAYQVLEILSGRGEGLFFGDYVLLDRVGTGATAHVYRARHLPSGNTVALKVLRTDLLSLDEARDCLCREGRAGVRLSHPNLVKVHGAFRKDDSLFLV